MSTTDTLTTQAMLVAAATPRIAPAAAEMIRAAGLRHSGRTETVFRCTFDEDALQLTSAVPVFRGSRDRAIYVSGQFRYGELALHTHPTGAIEPSDADLDTAGICARDGVGFAICDTAATALYVVTTPADVALRIPPPTAAMLAWSQRIRRWNRTVLGWSIAVTIMPRNAPSSTTT